MDKRYLVYEKETGLCVNVIIWDGKTKYDPGEGFACEIIPAGSLAWSGWKRTAEGEWEPPEQINKNISEVISEIPKELLPEAFVLPPLTMQEPPKQSNLAEPDFDETT